MFGFSKILGSNTFLGVDIGTTSIKIAEIGKSGSRPQLKNYGVLESYGHLERVNNAIQTNSMRIMENDTVEILKMLLERSKFKTDQVVASIPAFAAFSTLIEIPKMNKEEIAKTMKFQLEQHIPMPASEVEIEWLKVGEKQDDEGFIKEQVLLISIPKDFVEKYKKIFKAAGLFLHAIELESLSLVRALYDGNPTPTLFVDIGARSTNIVGVENGGMKLSSQTDFASANLTQSLSTGLGVNVRRAEKLKKDRGIAPGVGSEISTLMIPHLDVILKEVERTKNKYEQTFVTKIERIILAGGGSTMKGIAEYTSRQFNLPVEIGNPFNKVSYPSEILPILNNVGPIFSVSVGLGIKEYYQ